MKKTQYMIRSLVIHFSILLICILYGGNLYAENKAMSIPKYSCSYDAFAPFLDSLAKAANCDYGIIHINRDRHDCFSFITIQLFRGTLRQESDSRKWRVYGIIQDASIPYYLIGEKELDLFQRSKRKIKVEYYLSSVFDDGVIDDSNLHAVIFDKIQLYEVQNDFSVIPISSHSISNKYPYIIYDSNDKPIFETAYEEDGNELKRFCKYYHHGKTVKAELLNTINLKALGVAPRIGQKMSVYVFYKPDTEEYTISFLGVMNEMQEEVCNEYLLENKLIIISAMNSKGPSIVKVIF